MPLTMSGRLGIWGLLSELSVPWNREQTDSLAQGITEAGPRYQLSPSRQNNPPGPGETLVFPKAFEPIRREFRIADRVRDVLVA